MEPPRLMAIIARCVALGKTLVEWAKANRNRPLAEQEAAVRELVLAALADLLTLVLEASVTSQDPARTGWWSRACPACGTTSQLQDWVTRTVKTLCGVITFSRPWCRCPGCGHGWSPTDQVLELGSRQRLSAGLRRWIAELGARCASFRDARAILQRGQQLLVTAETIRSHTQQVGAALEAQQQAAIAQVARTQEAAEPVEAAPGQLVVEVDGTMVRYRTLLGRDPATGRKRYQTSWHEVKLGVVAGCVVEPVARDGQMEPHPRLVAPSYVAAREPPERFGARVVTEAARRGALAIVGWTGPRLGRGLAVLREVLVLGDGAVWIWELAAERFGQRLEILDFYHAVAHLAEAARALFGEDTAEAKAWLAARRHQLRHEGPEALLAALATVAPPTPEARQTLRRLRQYVRTHAARMAYPAFVAQGLPIGSGGVESAGGHLVQERCKRPGAHWSEPGAHYVLAVRCALKSRRPLKAA